MNLRKQLKELKKKSKLLSEKSSKLQVEFFNLDADKAKICREILIKEKILSHHKWRLCVDDSNQSIHLVCDTDTNTWRELVDLIWTNYHCSFPLSNQENIDNSINLCFDDSEISIYGILNFETFFALVDTYGINFYLDKNINNSIQKLISKLEFLNYIKVNFDK